MFLSPDPFQGTLRAYAKLRQGWKLKKSPDNGDSSEEKPGVTLSRPDTGVWDQMQRASERLGRVHGVMETQRGISGGFKEKHTPQG